MRERGGRTPPQNGGNPCKLSTIPNRTVCPSDARFHPITNDLRRFREMPSLALSRRQRGFESRWGHKIKPPLTRSDTSHPSGRRQPLPELRERAGSETSSAALDVATTSAALVPSSGLAPGLSHGHWASRAPSPAAPIWTSGRWLAKWKLLGASSMVGLIGPTATDDDCRSIDDARRTDRHSLRLASSR
jgi:hypothetical protein